MKNKKYLICWEKIIPSHSESNIISSERLRMVDCGIQFDWKSVLLIENKVKIIFNQVLRAW